ncbi:dicarboxylate carrier SLC25A8-like isoform X2 [Dromaius novaehollandiae]|uniref:dicarboxylate carrier SLC25A8-like isoform X2 n=1 Tax=Dromaius novaehollandiae TaxID=8790 RepID=UPI00311DAACF
MVGLQPSEVPPTAAVKLVGAGAAACVADLVTFPLDTAKVRLQIQGEAGGSAPAARYKGVFGTMATMVKTEGPGSLYSGLVAGLQRQLGFASVRIGLYDSVKQFYTRGSEHAGLGSRLLAGCTTGAMAVAVAQPTDVVKVRFQAQARARGPRRYQGTVDAYKTIAREEGVRGLWKGTAPNAARNAVVNCAELVTYDLVKEALLASHLMTGESGSPPSVPPKRGTPSPRGLTGLRAADNLPCHFVAAFGAGFCATLVASPVDVVKTRYMNSVPGQYGSAGCCALVMLRREGPAAFYKGFTPSFLRLGSWNVVMFVTYEQLKRALMAARRSGEAPF